MLSRSSITAASNWLISSRHSVAAIAQTIVTKFLLTGINIGTGLLTARVLGASGRGEQAAITLWPALISYLLTLGLPPAVRFCVRKDPGRAREFFTVAMVSATLLSLIAYGIGVAFIPFWLRTYTQSIVHAAQIVMIFAPEVMLGLILTAMLETLAEFKAANATRYIPSALTLAALGTMALTHTMNPFSSAIAYLVPPVLTTTWMAWRLKDFFLLRKFDIRPTFRTLGSYGIRSYGIDIMSTLSAQLDQVLVVGFLSATAMGVYVVALNASRVLQILHSAVVTVVFPSASGLAPAEAIAMVCRAARISTLISIIFATALMIALPFLIPLFYGPGFADAIHVGQILTVEALIGGIAYVLSQSFMACGRPALITALEAFGFAIALPCMLLLLPHFGLMGAASALLIATSLRLLILLVSFPLVLQVPIPNFIPTSGDVASFRRALES